MPSNNAGYSQLLSVAIIALFLVFGGLGTAQADSLGYPDPDETQFVQQDPPEIISITEMGPVMETFSFDAESDAIEVEDICLDKTYLELAYGDTPIKLTVSIFPIDAADQTVNWQSSDPSVVTVDGNGWVTPSASGTATATVTITVSSSNGRSASCEVLISLGDNSTQPPPPTPEEELAIVAGDKASLELGFFPEDSAARVTEDLVLPIFGESGSYISWESSGPYVVAASGLVVRPIGENVTVTLTATIVCGQARDTKIFTVTVLQLPPDPFWEDREITARQTPQKSWTIVFNQPVNLESAVNNIYVARLHTGLRRVPVQVQSTNNPCIITVSPKSGAWPYGVFYLFIGKDIRANTATSPTLQTGIRMRFNI